MTSGNGDVGCRTTSAFGSRCDQYQSAYSCTGANPGTDAMLACTNIPYRHSSNQLVSRPLTAPDVTRGRSRTRWTAGGLHATRSIAARSVDARRAGRGTRPSAERRHHHHAHERRAHDARPLRRHSWDRRETSRRARPRATRDSDRSRRRRSRRPRAGAGSPTHHAPGSRRGQRDRHMDEVLAHPEAHVDRAARRRRHVGGARLVPRADRESTRSPRPRPPTDRRIGRAWLRPHGAIVTHHERRPGKEFVKLVARLVGAEPVPGVVSILRSAHGWVSSRPGNVL